LLFTAALAAVFFASVSFKVANPDKIPDVLAKLPVVPELGDPFLRAISGAVIGLEAYVACALVFRFTVRIALTTAAVLSLVFSIAVAPYYEKLGGDCGCLWQWVPFAPESGLQLIFRNVCLASMAAWLLSRGRASGTGVKWKEAPSAATQRSS
jgi:hypothetical protein